MNQESEKPINPTAFPIDGNNVCEGMTLRDYFAAKAMQGAQANIGANKWTAEKLAKHSYEVADQMLKQRKS